MQRQAKPVKPSSDYDAFASVYDRHWGQHSLKKFAPILADRLRPLLPAGARVLDVCCGTGQIARWFSGQGFRVTALDRSQAMLDHARARAPAAEFVLADARDFSLPPVHSAAVSMFDSLNHILSPDELGAAFRCIHAALAPGGVFFCDFNMRNKFAGGWKGDFNIVEDDLACIVRTQYDDASRLARWDVTVFRRRHTWKRTDLVFTQRAYEEQEVQQALADAGFSSIRAWDALHPPDGGTPLPPGKTYFIAVKTDEIGRPA
ncbi:MAG TPA: methyltransferase domain-containing protein [Kiritimatiellia bacterium]|nr:methyltransferase domain-containing protein [Kiritimatiellia bacterium]HRZ12341.1 methyltransferase domain-containing protein [Kiritimatiellia bacterium]HSA17901.1 methyltransferase domain-containing protein [Kiritimatiellia bacterium]